MGFYCDSNLGAHTQKDKEKQQRIESDIQWGLKDPESGEVAQARGRPARNRGLAKYIRSEGGYRSIE